MRIISKYKDYYDGVIGYGGIDKTTVYLRENVKHTKQDLKYGFFRNTQRWWYKRRTDFSSNGRKWGYTQGSIFFCGVEYPYFRFFFESAYKTSYKGVSEYTSEPDLYLYVGHHDDKIREMFGDDYDGIMKNSNLERSKDNAMKIALDYKCPSVLIKYTGNSEGVVLIENPVLKDYNFQKVINPYDAFQEINMFMNGPLTQLKNKDPLPLTEKDQVRRHGFDEWTFRRKPKT